MLEKDEPDELFLTDLEGILQKNAKYLVSSHGGSERISFHQKESVELISSHDTELISHLNKKESFEETHVDHLSSDETKGKASDGNTNFSNSSISEFLEVQSLTPSSREEFIEFCRNKCSCFKDAEVKLAENENNKDPSCTNEKNYVECHKNEPTIVDSLAISVDDEQTSENSLTSPCNKRETCSIESSIPSSSKSNQAVPPNSIPSSTSKDGGKRKLEILMVTKSDESTKRFCETRENVSVKCLEHDSCKFLNNTPNAENNGDTSYLEPSDNEGESSQFKDVPSSEEDEKKCFNSEKELDSYQLKFIEYQECLLKAFTHTDVIALVREKLLEQLQNKGNIFKE